jgi:hypothetical protein
LDRELDVIDAIVMGKSMVWPLKRAQRQIVGVGWVRGKFFFSEALGIGNFTAKLLRTVDI